MHGFVTLSDATSYDNAERYFLKLNKNPRHLEILVYLYQRKTYWFYIFKSDPVLKLYLCIPIYPSRF